MRLKIILFYMLFFGSFLSAQDYEFIINDSLLVNVKEDRIEQIEIEVEVKNNTIDSFYINTLIGHITWLPLFIDDKVIEDLCDNQFSGSYIVLVYNDSNEILPDYPFLSVGDQVYFTKKGKLKYEFLEGVDCFWKRRIADNRMTRTRAKPTKILISPHQKEKFRMKIFLGHHLFEKGKHYYLKLKYTNKADDNLTKVTCLESNKMVLITK